MNVTNFVIVLFVVSALTFCVKCEYLFMSALKYPFKKMYSVAKYAHCSFIECCDDHYISSKIDDLDEILGKDLYGQDIAHNIVINALRGHLNTLSPQKALVMSFHGPPGTGKTYTTQMITETMYKHGDQSKFYHFFNGRNDFPLKERLNDYKEELHKIITNSLQMCERSIFVFDEVDKMPEGLLNVLVPFLDYNKRVQSWKYSSSINPRKAIFIFLSNTGSSRIIQHLLTLWTEGKQRKSVKIQDLEKLISIGAFNEKGGFYHSDTIDSSVIDHYVPFLPLEEPHVRKCLEKAFIVRNTNPTSEMLEEALSHVIYGPSPHNIYATAGCKRLEQKVAAIIYDKRQNRSEL